MAGVAQTQVCEVGSGSDLRAGRDTQRRALWERNTPGDVGPGSRIDSKPQGGGMGSSEPAWYMGEAGAVRSWAGFLSSLNLSLLTCKVGGSNQRVLKTLVQPWIRNAHGTSAGRLPISQSVWCQEKPGTRAPGLRGAVRAGHGISGGPHGGDGGTRVLGSASTQYGFLYLLFTTPVYRWVLWPHFMDEGVEAQQLSGLISSPAGRQIPPSKAPTLHPTPPPGNWPRPHSQPTHFVIHLSRPCHNPMGQRGKGWLASFLR